MFVEIGDTMRRIWPRVKVFFVTFPSVVGIVWLFTEIHAYFTGDSIRAVLGLNWWLPFIALPMAVALLAMAFYRRPSNRELAVKKTDDAREKVRQWGKRVTYVEWDEQAWHLLGHALQFAHEAIENDPEFQRPWTLLADIYCRIGNEKLARECLKRSYKLATPGPYHPGRFYREVERRIERGCTQTMPRWFEEKYARYWVLPR